LTRRRKRSIVKNMLDEIDKGADGAIEVIANFADQPDVVKTEVHKRRLEQAINIMAQAGVGDLVVGHSGDTIVLPYRLGVEPENKLRKPATEKPGEQLADAYKYYINRKQEELVRDNPDGFVAISTDGNVVDIAFADQHNSAVKSPWSRWEKEADLTNIDDTGGASRVAAIARQSKYGEEKIVGSGEISHHTTFDVRDNLTGSEEDKQFILERMKLALHTAQARMMLATNTDIPDEALEEDTIRTRGEFINAAAANIGGILLLDNVTPPSPSPTLTATRTATGTAMPTDGPTST
jgi:hypothetical protein